MRLNVEPISKSARTHLDRLARVQLAQPSLVLAFVGVITAIALALATQLQVLTGFEALLPESRPSVQELRRVAARAGGVSTIFVVLEGQDTDGLRHAADALVPALGSIGPEWVSQVEDGVHDVIKFCRASRGIVFRPGSARTGPGRRRGSIRLRGRPTNRHEPRRVPRGRAAPHRREPRNEASWCHGFTHQPLPWRVLPEPRRQEDRRGDAIVHSRNRHQQGGRSHRQSSRRGRQGKSGRIRSRRNLGRHGGSRHRDQRNQEDLPGSHRGRLAGRGAHPRGGASLLPSDPNAHRDDADDLRRALLDVRAHRDRPRPPKHRHGVSFHDRGRQRDQRRHHLHGPLPGRTPARTPSEGSHSSGPARDMAADHDGCSRCGRARTALSLSRPSRASASSA